MKANSILFNSWSGAFFHPGGGEVQLLNSKKYLEKMGYNIDLYNQWIPQKSFDIFHQFSVESGVDHVVSAYHEQGKKIIVSPIFWSEPARDSFHYQWIKRILDKSNIIMTNSEAESEKLSRVFEVDISRFHKTRNSITSEYFLDGDPSLFRKKYGIDDDYVLTIANIDRRKNTKMLVEVCKDLKIKLVSIGAVRDVSYYNEFKDSYSDFIQLGHIADGAMLKSACSGCSIFALPSLCETPGIAALEAASQGATIVITSEGPTEEYFKSSAIYVDPFSLDSIKSGIIKGLSVSKKDVEKQKKFIRDTYSWENTAQDIDVGYRKLF